MPDTGRDRRAEFRPVTTTWFADMRTPRRAAKDAGKWRPGITAIWRKYSLEFFSWRGYLHNMLWSYENPQKPFLWLLTRRCFHTHGFLVEGPTLIIISVIIGFFAGLDALIFHYLIAIFHNLFIQGRWSFSYPVDYFTPPSIWGPWIIIAPVAGSVLVTFLVQQISFEVQGPGVSQVLESIHKKSGRMRLIVAITHPVATAITLGSGGSVGIEGPAVQFGAVIGAFFGQLLKLSDSRRIHLVACGVSAGIAAVFNAPLGGLFFALEVVAPDWKPQTILTILLATVAATWVAEFGLGNFHLLHYVPVVFSDGWLTYLEILILGIVSGIFSLFFIHWMNWSKQISEKLIKNSYIRHMTGMFLVGILIYLTFLFTGHYYIDGGSYAGMVNILSGKLHFIQLLLVLMIIKIIATGLTIGTGGSGGIFSPALFVGSVLGAVAGYIAHTFINCHISIALFILCGMAGMLGATSGAILSAPVMLVELTTDYHILLAAIVSSLSAFAVRRAFLKQSIYTYQLFNKGLNINENYYISKPESRS